MPRTRALVRQWTLLRVLSQHIEGLSIDDMARQTGVNARTIRRDLKLFVEAGIPLRETVCTRNKKIWRIDSYGARVLARHSSADILALALAELLLEPIACGPLLEAIEQLRQRMTTMVSGAVRRRVEQQLERLRSDWRRQQVQSPDAHAPDAHAIEQLWRTMLAESEAHARASATLPASAGPSNGTSANGTSANGAMTDAAPLGGVSLNNGEPTGTPASGTSSTGTSSTGTSSTGTPFTGTPSTDTWDWYGRLTNGAEREEPPH